MIERLLEALLSAWERLTPMVVVPVYMGAGVLRLGHYSRTLGPGLHWKIPVIEEVLLENTVMTTLRLQPQTCTTEDGVGVVVTAVVKYRLSDLKPYVCGVVDQDDVLVDVSMGAVLRAVNSVHFEALVSTPPEAKVAAAVRRQVSQFGIEVLAVTFTDIGRVRSLRLIAHTVPEHFTR